MKKKSWIDIGISIIKLIFLTIFLCSIVYTMHYVCADKYPLYEPESVYVMKDWIYYDQLDVPQQLTTPCVLDVTGRDTFKFESTLPDSLPQGSVLSFLNLSDIDLAIDGKVFYSWRQDSVPIWGGPAKNSYFFVDIPSQYAGHKLTITRYGTYNKKFVDVFVGPKDEVVRKLEVKNGMLNFALSLFLLILSFLVILGSFFLKKAFNKKVFLTSISLGIFVSSCWLVFDSFVFQFVFMTRFIDGLMSYVSTLSILFAFMYYLDDLQEHRFHTAYFVLGIIQLINQIIFITLHITGIRNISLSLVPLDTIILLGILAILVITIIDLKKNKAGNYRVCVSGFVVFMLFAALEIILINVVPERVQGTYILIGLYILLVFAIIQEYLDIRKIQKERDLATGNANARTQFLANMSHEIRTPINSILGMNETIIKETKDPKIASYAGIVNESGELLLSLINDILDFSKMDSGKHEVVNSIYNPKKVMNSICTLMREKAESKNLNSVFTISSEIPDALYGDSNSLSQILANLLSNAIKYTESGGICLSAGCEIKDQCILRIKVTDTGIGIKHEDLEMIFDPFSRTDLKKNQSIQGTGLGLAITKQLVEEIGGSIKVESEYGIGSTFIIALPQRIPSQEDLISEDESNDTGNDSDNKFESLGITYTAPNAHILVVDDNSTNLIVVQAFLKNIKLNIDMATSGVEAVNKCCQNEYNVILMDHMMPGCDGIEAMHLIKEKNESLNKSTPIIILTANAIKGSDAGYISEGFDNYLSKPVDSVRLIKMLRMYLPNDLVIENNNDK